MRAWIVGLAGALHSDAYGMAEEPPLAALRRLAAANGEVGVAARPEGERGAVGGAR